MVEIVKVLVAESVGGALDVEVVMIDEIMEDVSTFKS